MLLPGSVELIETNVNTIQLRFGSKQVDANQQPIPDLEHIQMLLIAASQSHGAFAQVHVHSHVDTLDCT